MRKVTLFIAVSLDGYIADRNGDVNWLNGQEENGDNFGSYSEFISGIDTVIMGWNTYHQVVTELSPDEWVYPEQKSYVITHLSLIHISWNRCGRQCQHINVFLKLFDFFLMSHAEALLLINDQQPQILKFHIGRQNPVCSDHDIHQSLFQIRHRPFLFRGCPETAQQIHSDREILHALHKGIVMLLGEDRRRHQIDYLLSLIHI